MYKTLKISVDLTSWPGPVPSQILSARGTWNFSLLLGLLHTAWRTRPPQVVGFHLTDTWAWHRYLYAFDPATNLKLRREWTDIDPHQKTILSDEIGMGLTTQFLSETLDIHSFYDTRHFIKILNPKAFQSLSGSKRGPGKCPDFIGEDSFGDLSVIECKGTQTSQAALLNATNYGIEQKNNVGSAGSMIKHAIVAGLYIPQFNHAQKSRLHLVDPNWEQIAGLIKDSSNEARAISASQLSLGQAFYFSGLPIAANFFCNRRIIRLQKIPGEVITELRSSMDYLENGEYMRKLFLPSTREMASDQTESMPELSVSVEGDVIETLLNHRDPKKALLEIYNSRNNRVLRSKSTESFASIEDTYGLKMSIKIAE